MKIAFVIIDTDCRARRTEREREHMYKHEQDLYENIDPRVDIARRHRIVWFQIQIRMLIHE